MTAKRAEVIISPTATIGETIKKAANAIHEKRKKLEEARTRFEINAEFCGQSRLIEITPTRLVYEVWLGKVESKSRK